MVYYGDIDWFEPAHGVFPKAWIITLRFLKVLVFIHVVSFDEMPNSVLVMCIA